MYTVPKAVIPRLQCSEDKQRKHQCGKVYVSTHRRRKLVCLSCYGEFRFAYDIFCVQVASLINSMSWVIRQESALPATCLTFLQFSCTATFWCTPYLSTHNGRTQIDLAVTSAWVHQNWCTTEPRRKLVGLHKVVTNWKWSMFRTGLLCKPKMLHQFPHVCRFLFFINFCRTSVLFMGPLIPLFWTSGEVCPGFQN